MKTPLFTAVFVGWASLAMPATALTSADFLLHLCDSDDASERFACSAYITGALEMSAGYQNYWHAESPQNLLCARYARFRRRRKTLARGARCDARGAKS